MKICTGFVILFLAALSCKSPMPITANPSDHTNASGTLGSAKMTTELPKKSDNMKIPDTARIKNTGARRDTM
jgi:hypothetical protein